MNNTIEYSNWNGISIAISDNITLCGNQLTKNSHDGIQLSNGTNSKICNNNISNNGRDGIFFLGYSNGTLIRGNDIIANEKCGIRNWNTADLIVYKNNIGWNGEYNALDDGANNVWDNDLDQGNWWGDYSSGTYTIPGSAGSIDQYPSKLKEYDLPIITSPENIEYEAGTLGHIINWSCEDLEPSSYYVYRNGTEIDTDDWNDSVIIVLVDGLNPGVYNYTLQVFDRSGNHASDAVSVFVVDTGSPTISHPDDVEFIEGTSGNLISWDANDLFPEWYEIYLNGSLDEDGIWNEESISYNLDDLTVGSYNLTLVIRDSSGNAVQDSVQVSVLSPTSPTTSDPVDEDLLLFGMILGISSISVVIVVVLLIIYKRK